MNPWSWNRHACMVVWACTHGHMHASIWAKGERLNHVHLAFQRFRIRRTSAIPQPNPCAMSGAFSDASPHMPLHQSQAGLHGYLHQEHLLTSYSYLSRATGDSLFPDCWAESQSTQLLPLPHPPSWDSPKTYIVCMSWGRVRNGYKQLSRNHL